MLRNYLIISLRNLQKHFSYAFINVSGLALGLATCLLLVTWIRHELSYDRFHENAESIYRVSMEYSFGGHVARTSVSPNALLPALIGLPETQTAVRLYNPARRLPYIARYGEKLFQENKFYFADSTFFKVFSFNLIKGNPEKALTEPYSLVLTENMARKYFGDENPLGKTVLINDSRDYKVTGVLENVPSNSFLQFDFVASFHSIPAGMDEPTWWSANYQTFVLVHPGTNLQVLAGKTNEITRKAVAADLAGENDYVRYNFLALNDIYLRSDFDEAEVVGDIKYVYIFAGVTVLILVIACINYINLATARAAGRAKEVGIRKVSGALRKQLFYQFIGESLVLTGIAFLLAISIALILLPFFNQLTGKDFTAHVLFDPLFLLTTLAGLVIIGLVAGAYPAVALASFDPVKVLKGNFKNSDGGIWLRKSLVVFQFGISVILITATLIVIKQLDFISNRKVGFDLENTIALPLDAKTKAVFEPLKTELKRMGAAVHVARGSESPVHIEAGYSMNTTENEGPGIITTGLLTDGEYIPALGMQLIACRNFSKEDVERLKRDTVWTFILNEAGLAALSIPPDEAVGSLLYMSGRKGEIVGVVRNFHFSSLHSPIVPLVMFPQDQFQKIFIKLPPRPVSERLENAREVWDGIVTHRPFEFEFLDENYTALYRAEERIGSIATVFAGLAIIIACLGLFGLVSFSAAQRSKENRNPQSFGRHYFRHLVARHPRLLKVGDHCDCTGTPHRLVVDVHLLVERICL